MSYLRKNRLTMIFLNYYLFLSLALAGCKKDTALNLDVADTIKKQLINVANSNTIDTTTTATPLILQSSASVSSMANNLFDAALNKRGDLSAYAKTPGNSLTAMVINPKCITVVKDPVYGKKRNVMLLDVKAEDTGGVTSNSRAQVQTPMQYVEGQEVYVGFSVRFTSKFWTYFLTFSEFYGAPYAGTSPFRFGIQESNIIASSDNGVKSVNVWKTPMEANVWYDFVYREVLSKNPNKGKVQAWLRKQGESSYNEIIPTTSMATITASNILGPNYHKLACYYDRTHTFTDVSKKTHVKEVKMFMANHKVGKSFTAVAPTLTR
jgi:hypothetical protein